MAIVKSKTTDFFAWTNDEVELLLKVTHEYQVFKVAEKTLGGIARQIWQPIRGISGEHYPSLEETMPRGKEPPHRKVKSQKVYRPSFNVLA